MDLFTLKAQGGKEGTAKRRRPAPLGRTSRCRVGWENRTLLTTGGCGTREDFASTGGLEACGMMVGYRGHEKVDWWH